MFIQKKCRKFFKSIFRIYAYHIVDSRSISCAAGFENSGKPAFIRIDVLLNIQQLKLGCVGSARWRCSRPLDAWSQSIEMLNGDNDDCGCHRVEDEGGCGGRGIEDHMHARTHAHTHAHAHTRIQIHILTEYTSRCVAGIRTCVWSVRGVGGRLVLVTSTRRCRRRLVRRTSNGRC
jgi:hypothetical protein